MYCIWLFSYQDFAFLFIYQLLDISVYRHCHCQYHTESIKTSSRFHPINPSAAFYWSKFESKWQKEKRAKDERKFFFPPTDVFSSRMILIMNGCPEEDERRRRRAEKRRRESEGRKEEKCGRSEAEECSPWECTSTKSTWNYECPHACACTYIPINSPIKEWCKHIYATAQTAKCTDTEMWTCLHTLSTLLHTQHVKMLCAEAS